VKIATVNLDLCGVAIRRGDRVLPILSSANRDPRQFPDADRVDLGRLPNRHLAFGWGIHFCLGAPLSRLEATLAFRSVLERLPQLELVETEPRWRPWLFFRGLESLPLLWRVPE
jgi:cytochrome P450